ncbi:MAG: DUF4390 domain-containing protein [Gammaproteobacteria bacterium]|nr:DUF4390 domain-containing protein [Gammaproteobacteria bacterium]
MPAFTRHDMWYFNRRWLSVLLAGCLTLLPIQATQAERAFIIKSLETKLEQGVYQLDCRIEYRLSEEALTALKNGVPFLILMNIEVEQVRWYWNKNLAELEQGYLLLYHALSEKFIVHNLNSGVQDHYSSLDAALNALGRINNLPLIDAKLLDSELRYQVKMRAHLDIESLPAPMRPLAYISSDWQLDSDWVSWPLTQ